MVQWTAPAKRQVKVQVFAVVPKKDKRNTGGKGVADERIIGRCIDCVFDLVSTGHYAQATAFLFSLHKQHFDEWQAVQRSTIRQARTIKELQRLTMIFQISSRPTLMESSHLVPGLYNLIESENICELLG